MTFTQAGHDRLAVTTETSGPGCRWRAVMPAQSAGMPRWTARSYLRKRRLPSVRPRQGRFSVLVGRCAGSRRSRCVARLPRVGCTECVGVSAATPRYGKSMTSCSSLSWWTAICPVPRRDADRDRPLPLCRFLDCLRELASNVVRAGPSPRTIRATATAVCSRAQPQHKDLVTDRQHSDCFSC